MKEGIPLPKPVKPERDSKKGLENAQATTLNDLAKEFADKGSAQEALTLIKKADLPSTLSLVTLVGIHVSNPALSVEALEMFSSQVSRSDNFEMLKHVLLFLGNRKRYFVDPQFRDIVERRMKGIDAEWGGSLADKNADPMNLKLESLKKPLDQIINPEEALDCASFGSSDAMKTYLDRYLELGGNTDDERYLKIKLSGISHGKLEYKDAQKTILKLAEVMGLEKFRSYVHKNSKKGNSQEGRGNPRPFRVRLLANYINLAADSLNPQDWEFIAIQAMDLRRTDLQKICYERLKRLPRDRDTQEVFDILHRRTLKQERPAVSDRTHHTLVNPVYSDFGARQPVNMAAAVAVGMWAKRMLEE